LKHRSDQRTATRKTVEASLRLQPSIFRDAAAPSIESEATSSSKEEDIGMAVWLRVQMNHIFMVVQNHVYTIVNGIIGREFSKYTAVYGVYIQFWQTLHILKR
jgi:hypothetical protein